VLILSSFVNSGAEKIGPPHADVCLFQCDNRESFSILLIDLEPILDSSEELTQLATTMLLIALICSRAILVYSCQSGVQNILKQFALLQNVDNQYFAGDAKAMRLSIGSSVELIILSSEKGAKNSDKIVASVMEYEEGFEDSIIWRNQIRELVTEVFPTCSGAAIGSMKPGGIESLLSSAICGRYIIRIYY